LQANAGVELSGDWLQPTLEQDAEGGDGGNVLSPEQEATHQNCGYIESA